MGAHNIDDTAQEIEVENIVMHESYYKPIEFALLRLNTDATMGEGRGTVCLPDTIHPLMDGKRCHITGWGPL